MADLRAELARCDAEIAYCLEQLHADKPWVGPMIGLRDWTQERRRIEATMDALPASARSEAA